MPHLSSAGQTQDPVIHKTDEEKYFAVKTLRFTDTEEAEELRERKELLRRRRQLKRNTGKEV